MDKAKSKIIVILGPTAVGKSSVAVELALKLNGEIISADSRQVYRGLDIGTGKITEAEMKGVPHYLLDIADPKDPSQTFTVKKWKEQAEKIVSEIISRGKVPIICGGTGFYISSLIDGVEFPDIEADLEAHKVLEEKPAEELFGELKKLDPRRASSIDSKNKRRLARAILIARELGSVPLPHSSAEKSADNLVEDSADSNSFVAKYDVRMIGLILPDAELKERIRTRLISRIDAGMIEEARQLHDEGLSYERMNELGLEYRYEAEFLQGKLTKEQLIEILSTKIWQYARRQKTWFRRDTRIEWFDAQKTPLSESFL